MVLILVGGASDIACAVRKELTVAVRLLEVYNYTTMHQC
jgi:hypothetical protein